MLTKAVKFMLVLATTLLGLVAVTFFIGRVVPIDPVLAIVGDRAPPQVYERARQELGLDRPLVEQFVIYVKKAATGDFGNSVLTTNPVMTDILTTFPGDARTRDARHADRHLRSAFRSAFWRR